MNRRLFKLGCLKGGAWVEHSHPAHFETRPGAGAGQIVATAPGSDATVLRKLAKCLEPPFLLLYVLHTPRSEGEPGRYQSPPLSGTDLNEFLDRFEDFLTHDGRFDLWIHSPAGQATLVWDRHNLIHAYGPLESFEVCLLGLGFSRGAPSVEFEHQHHYHPELDSSATEILNYFLWSYTPLKPEDEQFVGGS